MGGTLSSGQSQIHHGRFDYVMYTVAELISDDDDLRRLGYELGLGHTAIERAISKNWEHGTRSIEGNIVMLHKWAKHVKQSEVLPELNAALCKVGLAEVADTCLPSAGEHSRPQSRYSRSQSTSVSETTPGDHSRPQSRYSRTQSTSVSETTPGGNPETPIDPRIRSASAMGTDRGDHEAMPEDIATLREKLKKRYIQKYGDIKTSPVDPDSSKWLQNIFVTLVLILRSSTSIFDRDQSIETDKLYDLITKRNTKKGFLTRFAFLGKVGVRKSTLFSQIALDWALGNCLQDVNLLFLESFQDMEINQSFGNIFINHFPDMKVIGGDRIDQYIQDNQRKVAILITDLNEKKMDLMVPNGENAVVSIVRGDRYTETPVLITTIPYVVDLIKGDDNIRQLYTLIEVQGFSKEGSCHYINQFFQKNKESAARLLEYIRSNGQISEHLTPFPIFCSMLCHVWEKMSIQETFDNLETFSQVFKEICFSLGEQYITKDPSKQPRYEFHMKKVTHTIQAIGKVALEGLMEDQHTFTEEIMKPYMEDVLIACDIGILGRERRLASREKRQSQGKQFIEEFYFPHKLLQEYAASSYLASLFHTDPLEFNRIMTDKVLMDYNKLTYVLYFTAAHGGEVGKSVMKALCERVRDINFIIDVAFECHGKEALDPVKKYLLHKKAFVPDHSTQHTSSATVFALKTYGKELIEEVKHKSTKSPSDATRTYSDVDDDTTVQYTKALFDMPNLRSLQLANSELENEFFYTTMAAKAKKSKIMKLKHEGGRLDQVSSSHYSEAIVSMPHLQDLEMCDVELSSDDFYPKMADGASKSRIMTLKHEGGSLSPAASAKYAQAVVSMPNLQTLELSDVKLNNEFYPKLADGAQQSRIVTLKHEGGQLGKDASKQYAKAILTMPNLENLEICNVKLSDDFYLPTMATRASDTKIKKLKHVGGKLGPDASSNYAKGLSSMPNLQSLELENMKLHDDFYKKASTEAAKSNVETLRHADAELGPVASSYYGQGLCSMPNLRSLELDRVKLCPEFFSTMCAKSSTSEITRLRHVDGTLSSASSFSYAKGLFSMPYLRSLELIRMKLCDSFFKSMSSEASNSKIEKLRHTDADLSDNASSHYARGLCSMPKLQILELHNVKLKDEFSTSMATEAARPSIQTLVMMMCTVNRRILRAMLSLPRLQSLSLLGKLELPADIDDIRALDLGNSSVHDLALDCGSVDGLWKLGFHTSCQQVTKLTLYFYDEDLDSSETITTACSSFRYLTELHIHWQRAFDPKEFYSALRTSCPRLTKLSLTRIKMFNENATEIIKSLTALPHLTIVEMDSCWTDEYLDPIIAQVNNEGRVTVTVTHGPLNIGLYYEEASEIIQLEETQPPMTSIDGQTSRKTDDGDKRKLGLELEVQNPDINRALETNLARDKYHAEGIFNQTGGELQIPSYGFTLTIPPGALREGSSETITLDVLKNIPPEITLRPDEMLLTYGFQCLPSGLQFLSEKPVRLKIPHCANLIDPSKVQVALYFWNHEGEADRIVQTSRTCRVTCNHVEILLEHFTIGIVAFIRNALSMDGRRMSFMPFLPKIMPQRRNEIPLQFRMVNKPHGNSWRDVHDIRVEAKYKPVKDDDDEMNVKDDDMEVTCQLNDNDTCRKNVDASFIRKSKHTVYFELDFIGKANDLLVKLEVIQSMIPMEIMFTTHFTAFRIAKKSRRKTVSASPRSLASTSVAIPSQDASAVADEVSTSQTSDKVSGEQLNTLATHIPSGKYNDLSCGLGIEYDEAIDILRKYAGDYKQAKRECLSVWKNKSGGNITELKNICNKVGLSGLYTKHMN